MANHQRRALSWRGIPNSQAAHEGTGVSTPTMLFLMVMTPKFRIGITPDFYTEAKGKFESVLEEQLSRAKGVESAPMPPQPGKLATPDALNQFDAIFSLALRITPESLKGVDRLVVVARWGVG